MRLFQKKIERQRRQQYAQGQALVEAAIGVGWNPVDGLRGAVLAETGMSPLSAGERTINYVARAAGVDVDVLLRANESAKRGEIPADLAGRQAYDFMLRLTARMVTPTAAL